MPCGSLRPSGPRAHEDRPTFRARAPRRGRQAQAATTPDPEGPASDYGLRDSNGLTRRDVDLRDSNGMTAAELRFQRNKTIDEAETKTSEAEGVGVDLPHRRSVVTDAQGRTGADLRFQQAKRVEEAIKARVAEMAAEKAETEPASEGDDKPEQPREFKTLTDEFGERRTFSSFDAARRASIREHGPRPGQDLHHLVERCQGSPKRSGFEQDQIHSSDNLTWVDQPVHTQISARYSRKPFGEPAPLRDLLNGESWDEQYETGCDVLTEEMEKYRDRNH